MPSARFAEARWRSATSARTAALARHSAHPNQSPEHDTLLNRIKLAAQPAPRGTACRLRGGGDFDAPKMQGPGADVLPTERSTGPHSYKEKDARFLATSAVINLAGPRKGLRWTPESLCGGVMSETISGSRAHGRRIQPSMLERLNERAPPLGRVQYVGDASFGPSMLIERFRLENGLTILLSEDHTAPVIAYHTWYHVGSRHEREGKTGLAHLFEHLMFNETKSLPAGAFDRKLEEAGAENNAATWLDWTQYTIAIPKSQLDLIVRLEAERMENLLLREAQLLSEKEVVANERRYRVEDDVDGSLNELLWSTAFEKHPYRWPTIGWMQDIEGFALADCEEFYKTYYAPNNATLVVVGDVTPHQLLSKVSAAYGHLAPAAIPVEDTWPEPHQREEKRVEVNKLTPTEKLIIGYRAPALGDSDHTAATLLTEVLFGGRASRIHRRLIHERELATDLRAYVGPFRDPGLIEISASARDLHLATELLQVIDEELEAIRLSPIPEKELRRAQARAELGLLSGLTTVDGKASTIGFYACVLNRPGAAFERLEALRSLTPSDLLKVARRYFDTTQRTVIIVHPVSSERETVS